MEGLWIPNTTSDATLSRITANSTRLIAKIDASRTSLEIHWGGDECIEDGVVMR